MKITVERLRAMDACPEGVAAFERVYPDGLDPADWTLDEQVRVLRTELRPYFEWAWDLELVPQWSMRGADLSEADLCGAALAEADLAEADLSGADLYRADLFGADLSGADLSGADLSGADLHWANLTGADLRGVNLSGANLTRADLSRADLDLALADNGTVWPAGFDPEAAGVVIRGIG